MLDKPKNLEKYENPRTSKYSDRQLVNVQEYNRRHFGGQMPESTLLKLLVEQGLTVGPLTDDALNAQLAALGFTPTPAHNQKPKGKK